jgi:beta-lactamase class A
VSRQSIQNNISRLTRGSSPVNRNQRRTPPSKKSPSSRPKAPVKTGKPPLDKNAPATVVVRARRSENSRSRTRRKPNNPLVSLLLCTTRLTILGISISAIAGTALTIVKPTKEPIFITKKSDANLTQASIVPTQPLGSSSSILQTTQEITPLKAKIEALAAKYPKLQPGAFFVDLDNGSYINFQGETVYSAASTIKIPILIAFFQDVDAGKIRLDEQLTMRKELIGGGSGDMQYQPPGTKFTALETATKTIVISDNTATNMLIDRLGGKEVLNQRFREWGMHSTVLNNALPDLGGTNTTSPKDLTELLAKIDRGELVSLKSRDRILGIMQQTRTRTLLPQGLEKDAIIAHKTGDIGTVLGDAGIVDMPSGKRYIGTVLVKRSHNDYTARTLIQDISRTVYQHFKWSVIRPLAKGDQQTRQQPHTPQTNSQI